MCVTVHIEDGVSVCTCNGVIIDPDSPIWDNLEESEGLLRHARSLYWPLRDAEYLEYELRDYRRNEQVAWRDPDRENDLIERLERAVDNPFLDEEDKVDCSIILEGLRTRQLNRLRRRRIGAATRRAVIARDGGRCRYCGCRPDKIHLDHVVPFAAGGPTTEENLVVACVKCNRTKASRTPKEAGMTMQELP